MTMKGSVRDSLASLRPSADSAVLGSSRLASASMMSKLAVRSARTASDALRVQVTV